MSINPLGLTAAVTAFLCIWIGHVSVRKVEAATVNLWKPMLVAVLVGLTLVGAALFTAYRPLSTVFGILGITLLWDTFEIKRQAHRVYRGHAPANPDNSRHAAALAEPNSKATTLDLLKRDPVGRQVGPDEAVRLLSPHG